MSKAPKGIGTYARQLSEKTHGTPEEFARRHKEAGLAHAALLGCWQEVGEGGAFRQFAGGTPHVTAKYAAACLKEGIKVWLWGFPWLGHEDAYMDAMVAMAKALPAGAVTGFLHDPEVSYRDKNAKAASRESRGQGEAGAGFAAVADAPGVDAGARRLMALDRRAVAELSLAPTGITSYGMMKWHALPWKIFADGGRTWGSPQLYTVTPAQVAQGMTSWKKSGFDGIAPSIPAFGENSGENLYSYLSTFVTKDTPDIDGFWVWSYPQLEAPELVALKRWAEMLRDKAC